MLLGYQSSLIWKADEFYKMQLIKARTTLFRYGLLLLKDNPRTDGRIFPWGNYWDASRLNSYEGGVWNTAPVGSFESGISPCGCHDMAGNVNEWTVDLLFDDERGLMRGGTWSTRGWHCRCSHRCGSGKLHRNPTIGFRCAKDAVGS